MRGKKVCNKRKEHLRQTMERRTDEDPVSQKRLLVNRLGVYLDETPIRGIAKRLERNLDRRRMNSPADAACLKGGAEPGGLSVECA